MVILNHSIDYRLELQHIGGIMCWKGFLNWSNLRGVIKICTTCCQGCRVPVTKLIRHKRSNRLTELDREHGKDWQRKWISKKIQRIMKQVKMKSKRVIHLDICHTLRHSGVAYNGGNKEGEAVGCKHSFLW